MRELFTSVIVNIQQAVMLNIDKVSDVSVKVYDLNKMLRRTDYAVSHNTDAIETVESNVEVIESDLLTIKTDISSLRANSSHSGLNLTAKFGQIDHVLERVEGTINDGMLDISHTDSKLDTIRQEAHHAKLANAEEFNKLFNRMSAIEKALEKLGAYDEQDLNNPAAVEMDRLDEELSKFIVDEFNK